MIGGAHKFETNPKWLDERVGIWNELFDKQKLVYEGKYIQTFLNATILFIFRLPN